MSLQTNCYQGSCRRGYTRYCWGWRGGARRPTTGWSKRSMARCPWPPSKPTTTHIRTLVDMGFLSWPSYKWNTPLSRCHHEVFRTLPCAPSSEELSSDSSQHVRSALGFSHYGNGPCLGEGCYY